LPDRGLTIALLSVLACTSGCAPRDAAQPGAGGSAGTAGVSGSAGSGPAAVPEFRLARGDSGTFDLRNERGKVVVVFFGYTSCPDVCPTTLVNMADAHRRLGTLGSRVQFVFVTVDPDRDTPGRTMAYARGFDSTFVGLSGDSASLAAARRQFGAQAWITRDKTGAESVAHSSAVYIVAPDGRLARTLPDGMEDGARTVADAVKEELGA